MKYSEQEELVRDLRALADFIEQPRSIELPTLDVHNISTWVNAYGFIDGQYGVDQVKTKRKMKRVAKALGSCEKKYDSTGFELVKQFGRLNLTFRTSRESVCRAVPTGEKRIVPSFYSPEREEEVIEWVCEEPILAG